MPALGASPSYISHAASAENSRNGDCGSSSRAMRSRTGSLPRAVCFAIASVPPPAPTSACRSRSCSSNDTKCSRFFANSGCEVSTRDSMTAIGPLHLTHARDGACSGPTDHSTAMTSVFECVPNVSEGRRADVIQAIAAAAAGPDVVLLDTQSDAAHNRSVFTLVGSGDGVLAAAVRVAGAAVEHIDLRTHTGEHPRM